MNLKGGIFVLGFYAMLCKGPESVPEAFRDDIIGARHVDFKFDPSNLPKIGVTTEKNLDRMYPEGPTFRRTYIKTRSAKIRNSIFDFSRIVDYQYMKKEYHTQPGVTGWNTEEIIGLTIFINNGFVNYYFIKHMKRKDEDKWVPGRYNQTEVNIENWEIKSYPGATVDSCIYWLQWPREARYPHVGNQLDGLTEEDCENGVMGPKKPLEDSKSEEVKKKVWTKESLEKALKRAKELLSYKGMDPAAVIRVTGLTEKELMEHGLLPRKKEK
ncbi:hypothetical protein [Leptospira perolatii]|uniref:hypothetical protein n=1 Tax=Leptospira perolatii TaxID=2023191 RepID=UPI000F6423D4|nr:hypothetical protein [Leptospira perolatii]